MRPPFNLEALLARESYENIDSAEWVLLRAWLARHGAEYASIECNVPIGPGRVTDPSDSEATTRMWTSITRRRADLIASRGPHATIVEAKARGRFAAVTQLVEYERLVRGERDGVRDVTLVLACYTCDDGVSQVLATHGGRVELFERRRTYDDTRSQDRTTGAL
jgi:hypothetical protein